MLPSVASSCAATFRRSAAPSLVFCSLGSAGSIRANYAGLPARLRRTKCQFCMVRGWNLYPELDCYKTITKITVFRWL